MRASVKMFLVLVTRAVRLTPRHPDLSQRPPARCPNSLAQRPYSSALSRTMANHNGSVDSLSSGVGAVPQSPCGNEPRVGAGSHISIFLDRTFRMVETLPDDVICWSEVGDSIIVKQASDTERGDAAAQRDAVSIVVSSSPMKHRVF